MTFKRMMTTLSLLLAGTILTASAVAQCTGTAPLKPKLHRQAWQGSNEIASLINVSSNDDPIVGMWRIQFLDGTNVIDQGIVQWHNDGTEMMNSSRNPDTQSFCMGVWKRVGAYTYSLNHYAIAWDPTTSTTTPQGLGSIRESVTLAKDGQTYSPERSPSPNMTSPETCWPRYPRQHQRSPHHREHEPHRIVLKATAVGVPCCARGAHGTP